MQPDHQKLAHLTFKGDVCWDKCRSREGKIFPLSGGTHFVYLCPKSFQDADPELLMRLALPIADLVFMREYENATR